MYGGNLVGRDVRKVWREDNVVKLLQFTDGNGAIIVDYLRSLREVQSVAARKVLPPEEVREKVISDYRAALKSVVEAKVICETPKCRIIAEEFPRYWAKGKSLYFANTQAHEATHSKFRQSEEAHGTRVNIEPYDMLFLTNTQQNAALSPRQEITEDTVDSLHHMYFRQKKMKSGL